ncbi:MAG: response regulator transcription factor [Caldilineales bacterium]|nr:response regulator transcription factor [Caldilineales bacterium]
MIRLLIAEDHPVVRDGLRGMLAGQPDLQVVGEAADGAAAVALAAELAPDVILMDLRMPVLDGVAAIRQIRARQPAAAILVLTTYDTDSDILPAIEAGATGYLLKDAPREELYRAIRATSRGETVLAPAVAARLLGKMRAPAEEKLSARELEVLSLVARGASNAEIAQALHISEATVKSHLLHIFGKLGVADRAAAVTAAV